MHFATHSDGMSNVGVTTPMTVDQHFWKYEMVPILV